MATLHILRSEPDERVLELIRMISPDDSMQIPLYEETVDYDRLIDALFSHDRVICWW